MCYTCTCVCVCVCMCVCECISLCSCVYECRPMHYVHKQIYKCESVCALWESGPLVKKLRWKNQTERLHWKKKAGLGTSYDGQLTLTSALVVGPFVFIALCVYDLLLCVRV